MLQTLVDMRLVALLQHSSIWLAVDPRTGWLLDMACMGQLDGGPGTAADVAAALGLQLPPAAAEPAAPPAPQPGPTGSEVRGRGGGAAHRTARTASWRMPLCCWVHGTCAWLRS